MQVVSRKEEEGEEGEEEERGETPQKPAIVRNPLSIATGTAP
jgi:hypothetical protein